MRYHSGEALALPPCHQISEPVKEVAGIVRAGGRLWVVLHRKGQQLTVRGGEVDSLDHVVIEADVADLSRAVRRLVPLCGLGSYRKAVIVRGHLHLAGAEVHYRLIDAAMAVAPLEGAEAERASEKLRSEERRVGKE